MAEAAPHAGALSVLEHLGIVLRTLSEDQYTLRMDLLGGHTIGQHARHILEFFECIVTGVSQGTVDYAARQRNGRLESEKKFALQMTDSIRLSMADFNPNMSLEVIADYSSGQMTCQSSLGRELMFAHDHAIHHLAMLRMAINHHWPEIDLPEHFGLAPSTLRYKSAQENE